MTTIKQHRNVDIPVRVVGSIADLETAIETLWVKKSALGFDLETTGLNPRQDRIVSILVGTLQSGLIIDCRQFARGTEAYRQLGNRLELLLSSAAVVVGQNLKFDWQFLAAHFNIKLLNVADTMLQEQVLRGEKPTRGRFTLEAIAASYGMRLDKSAQTDFVDFDKKPEWSQPFTARHLEYMAHDITAPLLIHRKQQAKLKELQLQEVAAIENAALPAFASMELAGCLVDVAQWRAIIAEQKREEQRLNQEITALLAPMYEQHTRISYERKLRQYEQALPVWESAQKAAIAAKFAQFIGAGNNPLTWKTQEKQLVADWKKAHPTPKKPVKPGTFLLSSPSKLKDALVFMGLPVMSTGSSALAEIAKSDVEIDSEVEDILQQKPEARAIINKILAWRKASKFITAFGEKFLAKIGDDWRFHPSYSQIGADTGRASCSSPNWQQIPSHGPGAKVRDCVVAAPGHKVLTCDLPNIELRILADMSGDPTMLKMFADDVDMHSFTARKMFGLAEEANPKESKFNSSFSHRDVAKTINFGIPYGMSHFTLAARLDIDVEQAEELFNKHKQTYKRASSWLQASAEKSAKCGYSLTIAGRKRFFMVITEGGDTRLINSIKRQAKNAPIQGSNADITKYAMALLFRNLPEGCHIIASVHDELVIEAPAAIAKEVAGIVATCMRAACTRYLKRVKIPFLTVTISDHWQK